MINWIINKICCLKYGHYWRKDGPTLGGDWIRCFRCNKLDEHLPSVHEPMGQYSEYDN